MRGHGDAASVGECHCTAFQGPSARVVVEALGTSQRFAVVGSPRINGRVERMMRERACPFKVILTGKRPPLTENGAVVLVV